MRGLEWRHREWPTQAALDRAMAEFVRATRDKRIGQGAIKRLPVFHIPRNFSKLSRPLVG